MKTKYKVNPARAAGLISCLILYAIVTVIGSVSNNNFATAFVVWLFQHVGLTTSFAIGLCIQLMLLAVTFTLVLFVLWKPISKIEE